MYFVFRESIFRGHSIPLLQCHKYLHEITSGMPTVERPGAGLFDLLRNGLLCVVLSSQRGVIVRDSDHQSQVSRCDH